MKTIVRSSWRAFLNRGPLILLPPTNRFFVSLAGPSGRPLGAPTERDQQLPDMPFVVADFELALDQVRHARAGPQQCFIAQRLRPAQQEFDQPFPITRTQPRFPPGPPRFLQRGRPDQAILPCPARYRLADDFDTACDFGLIQSLVQQSHRAEAPLLKCVEIALNSGGVAHA